MLSENEYERRMEARIAQAAELRQKYGMDCRIVNDRYGDLAALQLGSREIRRRYYDSSRQRNAGRTGTVHIRYATQGLANRMARDEEAW